MTFDDDLRAELREAAATNDGGAAPLDALDALRPAMRRARLRHLGARGAMAAAVVGLVAGSIALLATPRHDDVVSSSTQPVGTQLPEPTTSEAPTTTNGPTTTIAPATTIAPTTTIAVPTTVAPTTAAPAPPNTGAAPAPPATSSAPPPTAAPTGTPHTTTAPTTAPSTTPPTTAAPASRTISSACGTIVVSQNGSKVRLVSTDPHPGLEVDVKNDGPEEVEVGIAGSGQECEIKVKVESGQLIIEVDNHDD